MRPILKPISRCLAPVVLLLFLTAAARADAVIFQFGGEVVGGAAGETLTGTYTFDGDGGAVGGDGFTSASYALTGASVTHGATDFAFSGGTIQVVHAPFFFVNDVYLVGSTGMNGSAFELLLTDPSMSAFSDVSLPVTPPDLGDFPTANTALCYVRLNEGPGGGVLTAKITSLTVYVDTGPEVIEVVVDVKPGSAKNPLNPKSRGKFPVAILGDADFDVTTVDVGTVGLGVDGGSLASPVKSSFNDVDGDGVLDLLLHFNTQDIDGLPSSGTADLNLTAETAGGDLIEGTDTVTIVPGKKK